MSEQKAQQEEHGLKRVWHGLKSRFSKEEAAASDDEPAFLADAAEQEEEDLHEELRNTAGGFVHNDYELCIEDGAILDLWQKWRNERHPLCMAFSDEHGARFTMTEQELTKERMRLKMQLERDCRKRLKEYQELQDGKRPLVEPWCTAYLSQDHMVAWLFAFPPSDPKAELLLDEVTQALQQSNVTSGIVPEAVTYFFQNKLYFQLFPVACGTPVEEGKDGYVVEHYPRALKKEVQIAEDGTADYRSLNYVQVIHLDDVICEIVEPIEGTPGVRVDGKILMPKKVKAARSPGGVNTVLSEDGTKVLAAKDGHLSYSDEKFHVKPVLDIIGNVDYSTGNIDYRGDVNIYGDVRENFSVRATGTVTIQGLVEAATIEAGGDLLISSGVLGDNRAIIKSKGSIRAKYLENCVVYATKAIYTDCIISSQVFCDDSIYVTTGRGTVIGGALTAAHQVKARMIGSRAGRLTDITLGTFPVLQEELRSGMADLELYQREAKALEYELAALEEKEGLAGSSGEGAKTRLRLSVLMMKINQMEKHRAAMQDQVPDMRQCRLECDTIYPVTSLSIEYSKHVFEDLYQHCRAGFDMMTGEIKLV